MNLQELLKILDKISPFSLQEEWDNSGLMLGNLQDDAGRIFTSLDLDLDLLENLPPNATLISHHPIIFKPLKSLNLGVYPANLLQIAMQKNIKLIAMHTNYDKTHLNEYVAKNVLKWQNYTKDGFCIHAKIQTKLTDLVENLKKVLDLQSIKYTFCHEEIQTIALVTGSGADMAQICKADTLITGDVKFHDATKAIANKTNIIDITHFSSEKFFANSMQDELKTYNINATITPLKDPFTYK